MTRTEYLREQTMSAANKCRRTPIPSLSFADEPYSIPERKALALKWIFDNISDGTTVRIYDGSLPSGVTKPSAQKISSSSNNKGWDPTDPDPNNPWRK